MTFWCGSGSGSGSADPCLWLMDPDADPDPPIFIIDLQDANKIRWKKIIFCILFFEGTLTSFFKDKKSKRSHKTLGIKAFLTLFAWWLKGPDPEPNPNPYLWLMDPDPGSPKTFGSATLRDWWPKISFVILQNVVLHPLNGHTMYYLHFFFTWPVQL